MEKASIYVEENQKPDDLIVSTRLEIGRFYLSADQEISCLDDIIPIQIMNDDKIVWIAIDSEAIWFSQKAKRQWMERNSELLFIWYLRVREQINMKVYRFDIQRNQ